MHIKSNSKGMTLVELVIAISIVTMVLFGAYTFLLFAYKSLNNTNVAYDTGIDARVSMMGLEDYIRSAKATVVGGTEQKAVTVNGSGTQIDIYTNIDADSDMELVQYKLKDDAIIMGTAELGTGDPTAWTTVVKKVKNDMVSPKVPVFTINGYEVSINLLILDTTDQLMDDPVNVKASFTVRSKGAMD